ncbi:unnamed protein product [Owenia fusiformis]|nr:unnamed protein product [Owenia fusiformis]
MMNELTPTENASPSLDSDELMGTETETDGNESQKDIDSRSKIKNKPSKASAISEQYKNMKSLPGKLLVDFNSFDGVWYHHPVFKKYWEQYHMCMEWQKKHAETYNNIIKKQWSDWMAQTSQVSKSYTQVYRNAVPQTNNKTLGENNKRTQRRKRKGKKKRRRKEEMSPVASSSMVDSSDYEYDTEEQIYEITEELKSFFETTKLHKESRRKEKAAMRKSEKEEPNEYVNIEKATMKSQHATTSAPTERPGARRTSEMRQLYGKSAAMIHGMETAIQLTYDRNCDIVQPKLWPNMPLNISFST